MPILFRNAAVYAPEIKGRMDVLAAAGVVAAMDEKLSVVLPGLGIVDAGGLTLTPGFIDQHIHVLGGGGEGGVASRTPELMLSELVECGTTSFVGVLGTDSVTRTPEALLAKVRALTIEGATGWMHTSNYAMPPSLLTRSVRGDIFCVPEVLGVKIAMGDHRSSYPGQEELMRLLSDIRVGGMIAGKTGFLHVHLGNTAPEAFAMFDAAISRGFPIKHILPTHCARTRSVFDAALTFARKGGMIDITSGGACFATPAEAISIALKEGVDPSRLTMSSDGHGSIPRFDDKGVMVGLGTGSVASNLREFRSLVSLGTPLEAALPVISSNVAGNLGLRGKGVVAVGASADFCLFDQNLNLRHVVSRGRFLMRDGEVVARGTFEQ